MNIRKPIDYSAMHRELDTLLSAKLPQMNLYCEIGKIVSARPEKGAAVAAAEYLSKAYPDIKGFSPRNLRRMREFYQAYKDAPEALAEAMTIGWTQNITILEGCESLEERVWYIRAVRQFGWTKVELLEKLRDRAYLGISLDSEVKICYTENNTTVKKCSGDAAAQDSQRHRPGDTGPANGLSPLLLLHRSQLLHRGVHP